LPVELCGNNAAFSLLTQSWNKYVRPTVIVKIFVLSNVMALSLHYYVLVETTLLKFIGLQMRFGIW